ncbi:MAG: hypothetical protein ACR2HN_12140 [Tepidiformaceae bacterium]
MPIEALTHNDSGALICPVSDAEWDSWVSASKVRNFCRPDPLLDWLDRHGTDRGYQRDGDLPGFDPRTSFGDFIMAKGQAFEEAVLRHLETLVPIVHISSGWQERRSLDRAFETFAAMEEGVPVIAQGVLRNPERRTFGGLDLLVRSDVLACLFPGTLSEEEAAIAAPAFGHGYHYRVIDIKYSNLALLADGHASKDKLGFMAQTWLYNEALGRVQEFEPPASYLLGRGWKQGNDRGLSCMERLARVDQWLPENPRRGLLAVADYARSSVEWVRRVREQGAAWEVETGPSVHKLRANLKNSQDYPWHAAKQAIAEAQQDLTKIWWVPPHRRDAAIANGISRWDDVACCGANLGLPTDKAVIVDAILDVNRDPGGPAVRPAVVRSGEDTWRLPSALEFYVDFEWVNNLNDDFSRIPLQAGEESIFMIGCGHVEAGEWRFSCFVAEDLSRCAEATVIDDWFAHMGAVTGRLAPGTEPLVFHWSPAELSALDTKYNAARTRHPGRQWPAVNWYDLLTRVVRAEPVVVRGAFNFGLKSVARALHSHGLIETQWADGPADGLGAMAAAWACAAECAGDGSRLPAHPLMREVAAYNEVDCRVMMETLRYLRESH